MLVETQHVSSWLGVSYSELCSPLVFKRCGEAVSIRFFFFDLEMGHRKVFVVLFIFKANSGVAVKRDHQSLFYHPSVLSQSSFRNYSVGCIDCSAGVHSFRAPGRVDTILCGGARDFLQR